MAKRKHTESSESEADYSEVSADDGYSEDEIDISTALTGKRPKISRVRDEDDDDDLKDFIRDSITKRDVKEGTELLKKTKGKTKIVKGEVGGGSFQSMGTWCFVSGMRGSDSYLRHQAYTHGFCAH